MASYDDVVQWRSHEVTKQLRRDVVEAIEAAGAKILNRDVPDTNQDQYLRGVIAGLRTIFEWEPATTKETDNG